MNNYQLYRTNILLGGQVKWDIVVNNSQNSLYVSEFHLSPISNNIPYAFNQDDNLLNTNHKDNVKKFYNNIKGYFYKECLDHCFSTSWPIISTNDEYPVLYSNMYDMRCERSNRYYNYNKQFEFFCPVWIEQLTGPISFKFDIKNYDNDIIVASTVLTLTNNTHKTHNKFVEYFNTYINESGLQTGDDELINIVLKDKFASVIGLNVESGLFEVHNYNELASNLISHERPLIETDNLIIKAFENNKMICKQLFNFNLCFNIEDILPANIVNMMYGKNIKINVSVLENGQELPKNDFYTEYEYIKKSENSTYDNDNVLNYLQDYKYINTIDKNKLSQHICHWSLIDNNSVFNVYKGLNEINTDLRSDWINTVNVTTWADFYKYIQNTNEHKNKGIFVGDKTTINGIKYKYIPKIEKGIYILGMVVPESLLNEVITKFEIIKLHSSNKLFAINKNDLYIILTTDSNLLIYKNICNLLYTINKEDKFANELYNMLNSRVSPTFIKFNKSLRIEPAKGPSLISKEITYYNTNNVANYVIRYDGKIKPCFRLNSHSLYFKENILDTDIKTSVYVKPYYTKFEPKYPSIGYFGIKTLKDWSYNRLGSLEILGNTIEYSWFDINKFMVLANTINIKYTSVLENGHRKTLDEIVYEVIARFYNITDDKLIKYIKDLYTYRNNWDYISDTNIDDYVYNISLVLK